MITTTRHVVPIMFGEGASLQTGIKAKEFGVTKAIVICDEGVKNSGVVDPIVKCLKAEGIETVLFSKVLPDPPDAVVEAAGELARKENVDGLIAIGGGSSMDTAKATRILIDHPSPINQWFFPDTPQGAGVPLILIPTTAGTGSEVTFASVISDTKTGAKALVGGSYCYATISIVDPVLYAGVPPKPTAYCAFDAYTHAVDAICAVAPEPFGTAYGEKTISIIHKYLPRALENGQDLEARGQLAVAATMAGYSLEGANGCHLTHCVGHSLGKAFHMAHGLGCAICLPQLLELYSRWMPDRMKIVGEAMGLSLPDSISVEELGKKTSAAALAFMKQCGLPTLKEMGYSLEEVYAVVPMMPNDPAMMASPTKLSEAEFKDMITIAYNL